mmetsp:Transcript_42687/g.51833  ORF Transcript_42687/g.51833 Transcript_42687/m.51833 type:complete len:111 (-) Transcript_42687:394-726(-)
MDGGAEKSQPALLISSDRTALKRMVPWMNGPCGYREIYCPVQFRSNAEMWWVADHRIVQCIPKICAVTGPRVLDTHQGGLVAGWRRHFVTRDVEWMDGGLEESTCGGCPT